MNSIVLRQNNNKLGIINTNDKLFKLIKPNENTLLSNMSENMQDILLELLTDYSLKYRSTFNLK